MNARTSPSASSPSTDTAPALPLVALGLGIASVALITVVSFIAMALGLAAIVTGLISAGRTPARRPLAIAGAAAGIGAIGFFVLHIL
jgi:hypothetical protein